MTHSPESRPRSIQPKGSADLLWELQWQSPQARHRERLFSSASLWRDLIPPALARELVGKVQGSELEIKTAPGQVFPPYDASLLKELKPFQVGKHGLKPRLGRYYPLRQLSMVPGVPPGSNKPFRVVGLRDDQVTVDLNHPMSGKEAAFKLKVLEPGISAQKFLSDEVVDWLERLSQGPGMQARAAGGRTDFVGAGSMVREDASQDLEFYREPRLVSHIDAQARAQVAEVYASLLEREDAVLDLMSSWQSHLPQDLDLGEAFGLGLNQEELDRNPRLDHAVIHDLNTVPKLPFAAGRFEAVICTASVEYLMRPWEVFQEAFRVLKPGGVFVNTFSSRWFPPKVINIWTELHPFERMGLVLDYYWESGFTALESVSMRGWPRPQDDPHIGQTRVADPVFAVWGRKP